MPYEGATPTPSLSQKLDMQRDEVLDVPNVIGVGLGQRSGSQQVVVLVTCITDLTEQKLRNILRDIPFKIEEISSFKFQ